MFLEVIAIAFALGSVAMAVAAVRGDAQVRGCCPSPDSDRRLAEDLLPTPRASHPAD